MILYSKFKDKLDEQVLDNYLGKRLIATKHYNDRIIDRKNDTTAIIHIFRSIVDHFKNTDYADHSKFLVYSKKFNQAVAFSYQRDTNHPKDKRKHLIATTIFPVGDKHANPQTKLITVEKVEGYSQEFIDYVDTFIPKETQNEYPLTEIIVEGIDFYFLDGNLHNLPFTEFVEVE